MEFLIGVVKLLGRTVTTALAIYTIARAAETMNRLPGTTPLTHTMGQVTVTTAPSSSKTRGETKDEAALATVQR